MHKLCFFAESILVQMRYENENASNVYNEDCVRLATFEVLITIERTNNHRKSTNVFFSVCSELIKTMQRKT